MTGLAASDNVQNIKDQFPCGSYAKT